MTMTGQPQNKEEAGLGLGFKNQEDDAGSKQFGFFSWPGGKYLLDFGTDESPKDLIGGSAYVYFLIHNLWTFLFGLSVVVFQLFLFWVLWDSAGERINEDFRGSSEWISGLVGASFMLLLRVWPNVGRGIELLCMGTGLTKRRVTCSTGVTSRLSKCEWRLMCVGLLDLTVSVSCLLVGYQYSVNRATTVLRTITTATVSVFIAGIDEHMYKFWDYWGNPEWIKWKDEEIEKRYGSRDDFGTMDNLHPDIFVDEEME